MGYDKAEEAMTMQRRGWGIGSMIAATLLVAACSTSSGATAGPSSAVPAAATPVTPVTAASDLPAGMFTGHTTCYEKTLPAASGDVSGATGVECRHSATDPRMAGTSISTSKLDGSDPVITTITTEGTLTNSGGSWACRRLLMGVAGGAGGMDEICAGHGGYAGLTAYTHGISGNDASDWGVVGWIEGD